MQVVAIPEVIGIVRTVLFDSADPNIILVAEQRSWTVFSYAPVTARGPRVRRLGAMEADPAAKPLVLASGCVFVQMDTGEMITQDVPALSLLVSDRSDASETQVMQCASSCPPRLSSCLPRLSCTAVLAFTPLAGTTGMRYCLHILDFVLTLILSTGE